MPQTNPDKPLCTRCQLRNAQLAFKGLCNRCYHETRDLRVPKASFQLGEIGKLAAAAESDDDWKKLAKQLGPVISAVADGTVKATAAQTSMIKAILDRAFGKVNKTQEDTKGPIGVVILPTLGLYEKTLVCPQCQEYHTKHG